VPPSWEDEGAPTEDPYGGRSWFTPVIVGMVALVLAAGLGVGIYLIYNATRNNPPETGPSAAVTSAAATTAPPSSAPASPSPSPSPSPSAPAGVPIPALRGETERSATDALTTLGLTVVVQRRSDPSVEPGRVIGTDPPAGTAVADGSTVTLIVASAPAPSPSRSSPAPSPSVAAS
jgi:serine/threonine-protein kinase